MTLKEKVKEMHPEYIGDYGGGVYGCPAQYPYLNRPELGNGNCSSSITCKDCWNQKFNPEFKSITRSKLWRKIGKQPAYKTQNKEVILYANDCNSQNTTCRFC